MIKASIEFLLDKCRTVPEEVYQERLKICQSCPKWRPNILGGVCGQCGCITKLKLRLPKEECPLAKKKWNRY